MPKYKLIYFDARGRAEAARMLFKVAGVAFEDYRVPIDGFTPGPEYPELKKRLPFGQLPLLEVDGKELAQGHAIDRYLARELGMYGRSNWEAGQIDMWIDVSTEITERCADLTIELDPQRKSAMMDDVQNKIVPRIFPKLQEAVTANKSGFVVGDKISVADFNWLASYDVMVTDLDEARLKAIMTEYKQAQQYFDRIAAVPAIAAWRKIRPKTKF